MAELWPVGGGGQFADAFPEKMSLLLKRDIEERDGPSFEVDM